MISVIIPTYNERQNATGLIGRLCEVFAAASISDFEILVMDDDSPDGTAAAVNALGNPRARAVNRKGRPRGLSYAVIDGFKEAQGDILGVMDADWSHPVETVPLLVRALEQGSEVAVGSRYVAGGGIHNWPAHRVFISRTACRLARPVTPVKDSTSGFFFLRKRVLENVDLNPLGFKIGLEVYVKARHGGKVREVPYVFTDRKVGKSKFGPYIIGCYLKQVLLLMKNRSRKS